MSLLLISSQQSLSTKLLYILKHYFPILSSPVQQQSQPDVLFINNKYYTCNVHVQRLQFQSQLSLPHSIEPKVQCVIFLFDKQEELLDISAKVSRWLQRAKVQSVMICLDDKSPEDSSEWRYCEDILQCQAFIPVIRVDLDKIKNQLPKWINSGLLKNQSSQNSQQQIFALLELVQTTTWTFLQKKVQIKQQRIQTNFRTKNEVTISKEDQNQHKHGQRVVDQSKESTGKFQEKYFDSEDVQYNQQQLQEQMMQFEQLMSQMMQIKQIPVGDAERKKKAGDLIMKLSQNIDF